MVQEPDNGTQFYNQGLLISTQNIAIFGHHRNGKNSVLMIYQMRIIGMNKNFNIVPKYFHFLAINFIEANIYL